MFLAGGVPEVMLHLRGLGLLDLEALTAGGVRLGEVLEIWERSERRTRFRELLMGTCLVALDECSHALGRIPAVEGVSKIVCPAQVAKPDATLGGKLAQEGATVRREREGNPIFGVAPPVFSG